MKRICLLLAVLMCSVSVLSGCGEAAPSAEEQKKAEVEAKTNMDAGMGAMKDAMKQIEAGKNTK